MTDLANIPMLDLKAQYAGIRTEIQVALDRVIESQHFILGPEVEGLEKDVAAYSQCIGAVGVSSGSDAILIALMALGITSGDEVITSPFTFVATVSAIVRLGARPVFVDIDPSSFNIDVEKIQPAITPKTRAILPIHLFGQMVEMVPLLEIAKNYNIAIIEDAAQAIGSEYLGYRAGSMGNGGCLSFFPSKNLGGFGDGGMVVSNDLDLLRHIKLLRNNGQSPKYYCKETSGNFRLDEIQAAILRVKLKYLDTWSEARRQNAQIYRRLFSEAGLIINFQNLSGNWGIVLPEEGPSRRHIYNQFSIRAARRDDLKAFLMKEGIGTEIYYPLPMHLQESFSFLGYHAGDFLESEKASYQTLALPIYPELNEAGQQRIVETISRFYR